MSFSNQVVHAIYQGDGVNDTFAIPFQPIVDDSAETVVILRDETDGDDITETVLDEGALNDYVLVGAPDPSSFHVNVETTFIPTSSQYIYVGRALPLTQTLDLTAAGAFQPATQELTFDRLVAMIQQLRDMLKRVPKIPITAMTPESVLDTFPEPVADTVIGWDATGQKFVNMTPADFVALAGGFDDTQYGYEGFSARFSELFQTANLGETLEQILDITYTPPQVTLGASGSGTIREKGDAVTSTTLTAAITKRSDPIAEVRFYMNPSTLLDTQTSGGGIPSGGNSTYNWTGSFDDNTTFRVDVEDDGTSGGPTTVQATASFTFVYPYYVGADSSGLSAANVALLTKRVITSTSNRTETITAGNGEVFYFAYPASYGALTSILDANGFETLPDWTLRTENITGLDGNPVSYRIYEFNNPVTADDYEYTFIR